MVPQANYGTVQTERENAIINGIMSGDNACGALNRAFREGRGPDFLREKIAPALAVYEEEAADLRKQRDRALAALETRRRVLADVAANGGLTGDLAKSVDLAARPEA